MQYCVDVAYSKRSSKKNLHGVDYLELTAAHCLPDSRDHDYTGKLIVIKASELKPEYQTTASQLLFCSPSNDARQTRKARRLSATNYSTAIIESAMAATRSRASQTWEECHIGQAP